MLAEGSVEMGVLKEKFGQYAVPLTTILALIVIWQLCTISFKIPVWLLPAPSLVVEKTLQWSSELPMHTWITFYETLAGFFLAIVIAVPLAVMIAYSPFLQNSIYPILLIAQSIPKVAIAPLLLIWIGYGEAPKILVAFLVSFFPIVVDTATGLNAVEPDLLDLIRSLSANQWQIFRKIRFPSSLPFFFSGLKVAITLSVVGAVIGEFVGSDRGLGYLILIASSHVNTGLAFGAMAILSMMGIILFFLVGILERIVCPWYAGE
ncbi:MAG: ABC transporter permease [Chloroflexi bacterium]|nr:ABC transporter permease [Chloroflexota bacterium]MCL5075428.1 ABC transporter permease [Chloroflexota bacterium]